MFGNYRFTRSLAYQYIRGFSGDTCRRGSVSRTAFQETNRNRESTVRQRQVWSDTGQSEVCFYREEVKLIPPPSLIVDPESIRLSCSAAYTKRFTVRYTKIIAILTHPSLHYVFNLSETDILSSQIFKPPAAWTLATSTCNTLMHRGT